MNQPSPTEAKVSIRLPIGLYQEAKRVASQHYERLDTLIPKLLEDYIRRWKEANDEA